MMVARRTCPPRPRHAPRSRTKSSAFTSTKRVSISGDGGVGGAGGAARGRCGSSRGLAMTCTP
ncbi:hypothetical protein E2C01_097473 [Portunus trituberculatus]|uniref:Uncharacterized protein n=1 Tax=Portunus trituberculatus TaxID=210409 RepID=A0A5B7K5T7_PORTR|nr:hypothetical protein [Portunus trituberculatus]